MIDFETLLEQFYRATLRPGDTCIDVGANVGRHTLPIASCIAPSGRVIAFEPIPAMASELNAKLAESPDLAPMVELKQCALSDVDGEADFTLVSNNPAYSGLLPRHYDREEKTEIIRVAVHRLDGFLFDIPTVRYIKIDCEGGRAAGSSWRQHPFTKRSAHRELRMRRRFPRIVRLQCRRHLRLLGDAQLLHPVNRSRVTGSQELRQSVCQSRILGLYCDAGGTIMERTYDANGPSEKSMSAR